MVLKGLAKSLEQAVKKPHATEFPARGQAPTNYYKGIHKLDIKTCISCAACQKICPTQTIDMVDTETAHGTKKMPLINLDRCLFCALCEEVCPTSCLILTRDYSFEAYDRREYIKTPEELK